MISVNIDRLYAGNGELKSAFDAFYELIPIITRVKNRLSDMSVTADSIALLNQVCSNVGEYANQCSCLYQSMDAICQTYASFENRVLDFGEGAVVYYSQIPVAFVDLSASAEILHEFLFVEEGA